jgi:hypothetical protein
MKTALLANAGVHAETSRYLARETLVSAAINAAISVGFFLLVFQRVDPVPVWGMGNYAFDFVPQSFAIGLMATLVPGLLCRKAIVEGRIAGSSASPVAPRVMAARAVRNAILAVLAGAGVCALLLWTAGAGALAHTPAFVLKVLYGAALGGLVTRITLRRMVR